MATSKLSYGKKNFFGVNQTRYHSPGKLMHKINYQNMITNRLSSKPGEMFDIFRRSV